LQEKT